MIPLQFLVLLRGSSGIPTRETLYFWEVMHANDYRRFLMKPRIETNAAFFFSNETDCEKTPKCSKSNLTSEIIKARINKSRKYLPKIAENFTILSQFP